MQNLTHSKKSQELSPHNKPLSLKQEKSGVNNVSEIKASELEKQVIIPNPLRIFSRKITDASTNFTLNFRGVQLVVYNPTAKVLKLGDSAANTTDYLFVVRENKYFVSPVFYFSELYVFVDSFAAFSGTTPIIYVYDRPMFNPQVSAIT